MGTIWQWVFTTCSVLLAVRFVSTNEQRPMYMVKSPEPIAAPYGDEVTLECEMNIKPDNFRWRHYPLPSHSGAGGMIDTGRAVEVPQGQYTFSGKKSTLTIDVNDRSAAGDYQCLVTYGVAVLASVLGRVSIVDISDFGPRHTATHLVSAGNTVALRCDIPPSNPPADVQYYKSNVPLNMSLVLPTKTLLLQNVSNSDSGSYTCSAKNYISGIVKKSQMKMVLVITKNHAMQPKFLTVPPSNYTVTGGEDVFLECSAVADPPPTVTWYKLNGELPKDRSELLPGGLKITNVNSKDQGTYICNHGHLKHHIMLLFYERPKVVNLSNIEVKEGKDLDAECTVEGTPEPAITWLINGESVMNDSNIEAIGNKIYFRPIEKRHAGIFQCFAINAVGTDFGFSFLKVYPKQKTSDGNATTAPLANTRPARKKKKPMKQKVTLAVMIPPSKPNVTRLSDDSVMVRWSVPENDGLPIQFFKVQYRELGLASQQNNGGHGRSKGSRWKTTNADIIPHLRSYQVDNLKPDHVYKFRIAAVYSNNDNKLGPNSAKFHLKREDFFAKNPLPAPKLTHTETLNATAIKIYWEYMQSPNITIDGFYVNYQPASSAGDYFKVTVDGEHTRSYIINYLQADTSYDIKLQSYTTSSASDFSSILKQKTLRAVMESSVHSEVAHATPKNKEEPKDPMQMYIIIIGVVVLSLVLVGVIFLAIVMLKKKRGQGDEKRRSGDGNDGEKSAGVNEDGGHHIQADSNGYIAKVVPHGLSNGCGPIRTGITITTNPLADADDNQNQNMIEMACLSSQNNNCSTVEPSVSTESEQTVSSNSKNKETGNNRSKLKPESTASENYV